MLLFVDKRCNACLDAVTASLFTRKTDFAVEARSRPGQCSLSAQAAPAARPPELQRSYVTRLSRCVQYVQCVQQRGSGLLISSFCTRQHDLGAALGAGGAWVAWPRWYLGFLIGGTNHSLAALINTTIIGEGQPPEFFQIRELQAVQLLIVAFTIISRSTENTHLLFPSCHSCSLIH